MVLNDFEKDMDLLLHEVGERKSSICKQKGVVRSAYYTYVSDAKVTKKYVALCEALGYDIQIKYEKGETGIISDFKSDIKSLFHETGYRQKDIAEEMGIGADLLRGYVRRANITKGYVELCSLLGYGIKLEYIPFEK